MEAGQPRATEHRRRITCRSRRVLALMTGALAIASFFAPRALAIEPSGTFIQVPGSSAIYRVVGGAAIHIDSCAPLNGCPGIVQVPNLSGYAPVPANGSYLRYANGPSAGWIGRFIGGTPIHVDSCTPLSGCAGLVNVDAGGADDYIHAHPTPANGSFLRYINGSSAGWIGVMIGGAPVHVDSCAPLNGCPGTVNLDSGGADDYVHAHPTPPNGSYLRYANGPSAGWIGRFIGGTPIHVDSCTPLSGCAGLVNVDAGGANDYIHAHPTPANGSFLRYINGSNAGWIGVMIGGAPIHVDSCAPLNGCPGTVNLDSAGADDYVHAHPTPANGSFVLVADGPAAGDVARAAGGALIHVSDCAALGGCGGYVAIDSGGFGDYSSAHPIPADGTLLLGMPSNSTWEVLDGQRVAVGPSQAAVALNDESIAAIPIASPQSSGTAKQHLRRLHVKLALKWRWNLGRTQLVHIAVVKGRRRFKVRMSCSGHGCPRGAVVARSTHGLQSLVGRVYRAGDRIVVRVSAPGRSPERGLVVIRYGRKPRSEPLG